MEHQADGPYTDQLEKETCHAENRFDAHLQYKTTMFYVKSLNKHWNSGSGIKYFSNRDVMRSEHQSQTTDYQLSAS